MLYTSTSPSGNLLKIPILCLFSLFFISCDIFNDGKLQPTACKGWTQDSLIVHEILTLNGFEDPNEVTQEFECTDRKLTFWWITSTQRKLDTLPESFAELDHLKTVYLNNNNISYLPHNIGSLKNLEYLKLSENLLTELPVTFFDLNNLVTLDISSNKISDFSSNFEELVNLENLFYIDNDITSIPKEIANMKKLSTLYLSSNMISEIPDEFIQFINPPFDFSIISNKLCKLPESVESWLDEIDASYFNQECDE